MPGGCSLSECAGIHREFFPEHSLEVPFKYIMTDFTDKNVQFWKQHAQFAEMLSTGVLDIAVFNAETDTEVASSPRVVVQLPAPL